MAKFCDKCGTPLPEASAFCLNCGAAVSAPIQPAAPAPVPTPTPAATYQPVQPAPYQQPPQQYTPPPQPPTQNQTPPQWAQPPQQPYPPQTPPQWSQPPQPGYSTPPLQAKSSGSGLKILLIVFVVLAIGACAVVGGIWYVGHKVVNKVKDAAAQAGIDTNDLGKSTPAFHGDPCRFLSKADVSAAIGVTITSAVASDGNACAYNARGSAADMTAKHLSAMMGQRGAPKDTQKTIQQLAGGFFASQPTHQGETPAGEITDVPVLSLSFDTTAAHTQMQLNNKVLTGLGAGSGSGDLAGIGDEAFVSADGMLMLRKGDTMVRMMYISCPCSTEQIKPLAKKLADAM